MIRHRAMTAVLAFVGMCLLGCSEEIDSTYGRMRGASVNGTGALAELFRQEGHTVRAAVRLTDDLDEWADVIVRFAPNPGPPGREEADWYENWLTEGRGSGLIYVPRDYDTQAEYWQGVLAAMPKTADASLRKRVEKRLEDARPWASKRPAKAKEPAPPDAWFTVKHSPGSPTICKTLGGDWAGGIDPVRASLTRHETLVADAEGLSPEDAVGVLLKGDGKILAMEWHRANEARVLVVANGSFLLNAALVNRTRRPLAMHVARWPGDEPMHLAFVEGSFVVGDPPAQPSVFGLLEIPPFGWLAAQLLVLGLAVCLARAPSLGRPRPEPPSGEDRPVAHPLALGALWERTGAAEDARSALQTYRLWRHPSRRGERPPE